MAGFAEQLQKLTRQRTLISGRPPSREEVAGVVEGAQRGAETRLARKEERKLTRELQTERIESEESRFTRQLAEEKRRFEIGRTELSASEQATLGFSEKRLTSEESRFGETLTFQREQAATQAAQFTSKQVQDLNIFTLSQAQTMEQFTEQLTVTKSQFTEGLAEQTRQFNENLDQQEEALRRQYEEIPESVQAQMDQQRVQFEASQQEQRAQFDLQLAESSDQFDRNLLEIQKQHTETMELKNTELRQQNEQFIAQLGAGRVESIMEAFFQQGPDRPGQGVAEIARAFEIAGADIFPTTTTATGRPQVIDLEELFRGLNISYD